MLPRLRNKSHYSQRQIYACHIHKFKGIVKTCRVGTAYIKNRNDILHSVIYIFAFQYRFTAEHFVNVTCYCIDFSVMYHHTVRVRTLPAWVCVCTETRMNNTDRRTVIRTVKIFIEHSELIYQKHSFIYNSTAGT